MDTRAHFALIGAFAVTFVVIAVLLALWLAQTTFDQEVKEYEVVFTGPVRGLSDASEVRFNGIKVGEVTRLSIDPADATLVLARIRIDAATPITEGAVAQLEPQGITGLAYIQITAGPPGAARLTAARGQDPPRLPSQSDALTSLVESSGDVVMSANDALLGVQATFSSANVRALSVILQDLQVLSGALRDNADLVGETRAAVTRLNDAAAQMETAARDISAMTASVQASLDAELSPALVGAAAAARQVEVAARDAQALLALAEGPLTRFSADGLEDVALAAADLRRLTQVLERIAQDIERDPAQFLAGGARAEVELGP